MRAINSAVMKQANRRLILSCIRRRPASRSELSDQTQLTRASITQIVDSLIAEGLVVESTMVNRRRPGRRRTQLAIAKDALYIAGLNISRDAFDLSLINLAGKVLWHSHNRVSDWNLKAIQTEIVAKLSAALKTHVPDGARVYGLGVCLPSPLDHQLASPIRQLNAFEWDTAVLAEQLRSRLGLDIFIGNITNAYAQDELYFGVGHSGVENFMLFRVDETVSVAFIVEGRLLMGARGFSPEIGHITVMPNGLPCKCGNRGCLKNYVSVPAMLKDTPYESWPQFVDALDTDPHAAEIFAQEANMLAFEIVNLANVLDLDKVVLTGDLTYGGERMAERINRRIDEKFVHRMGKSPVSAAKAVNVARIACMPAFHSIFA